jgi:hypothetical protein
MRFQKFSFGSIQIEGVAYEHDVVIDRWKVRKRKKKPSKQFRDEFGHTPVSIEEKVPWQCHRHRNRRLAGDGRGEARGETPQDRLARPPNRRCHRGV